MQKADVVIERDRFDTESRILRDQESSDQSLAARQERLLSAEAMTAEDLKPWNAQQVAAATKHDLWEQFGSPGFLIAMLGSAFTAMPMVSALNGGAAAMNAINQGDLDAYDRAFEQWKTNTDLVMKRLELEQKAFDNISHLRTEDRAEYKIQLADTLAKFDHQRGLNLLENGYDEKLENAIAGQKEIRAKIAQARFDLLRNDARMKAIQSTDEYKNKDWQGLLKRIYEFDLLSGSAKDNIKRQQEAQQAEVFSKQITETPEEYWSLSDAERFKIRTLLATYKPDFKIPDRPPPDSPPPSMRQQDFDYAADLDNLGIPYPVSGRGQEATYIKQKIHTHALQRAADQGLLPGDIALRKSEVKAETATLTRLEQMRSAIDAWSNTTARNGRILEQLAEKKDTTGVPALERWIRAGRKEIAGDGDVNALNAQMGTYRADVERIVRSPNLTGVLTNEAIREANTFLSGNETGSQIRKVTDLFEGDFERRRVPLQNEIDHVMDAIRGKVYRPQTLPPREDDTIGYRIVE